MDEARPAATMQSGWNGWRSLARCWLAPFAAGAAITSALTFASPAQKGDLELGRYLATECLTCHRAAKAGGAIPNIFGMDEAKFIALLKAYRAKQLPNPIMQSIAGRLTDDEIEALAHYFAVTKQP